MIVWYIKSKENNCAYINDFYVSIEEDDKFIQEIANSIIEAELWKDCLEQGMLGLLFVEQMC